MDAVDMAAFVAMAGVDTGADETVANVEAGIQGGFHIGTVEGVHIHRIVSAGLFGSGDELASTS